MDGRIRAAFATGVLALYAAVAGAAPGDVDSSYASAGIADTTLATSPASQSIALALQPDGKAIALSGDPFTLARLHTSGSLDTAFGSSGTTTALPAAASGFKGYAMAVQPDGAIVVAGGGAGGDNLALVRYLADGTVDTGFGNAGLVSTSLYSFSSFRAVAITPEGRILAAGMSREGSTWRLVVYRFLADGSYDSSFNPFSNITSFAITTLGDHIGIALQDDGRAVVAARVRDSSFIDQVLVRRLADNGSVEFSTRATLNGYASIYNITSVLVQKAGRIVVGGTVSTGNGRRPLLVGFTDSGALDTAFGNSGSVVGIDSWCYECDFEDIALAPDGKIVATGYLTAALFDVRAAVLRFGSDGYPDTAFGNQGVAISGPIGNSYYGSMALALQPDGDILTLASGSARMSMHRFEGNGLDLQADAFSFTDRTEVANSSLETSDIVTVAGLDANVSVPLRVTGGEYALNGDTAYRSGVSHVANGDTLAVRHSTPATGPTRTDTLLEIGLLSATNSPATLIGTPTADTFSTTTQVPPQADLRITKDNGVASIAPGDAVQYTITVSNAGPDPVFGATVTDTLPNTLVGATWTCVATGGATCSASGSSNIADSVDLPVGGSVTYTLDAGVATFAVNSLSNTASVANPLLESAPGDESATDTDTLIAVADGDIAPLGSRDGQVRVADALVALRYSLGLITPIPTDDLIHGDVAPLDQDGKPAPDGEIRVSDALVILRKALGLVNF